MRIKNFSRFKKVKKTRILQKMHIATPKMSLNKLHSINMFFFPELYSLFWFYKFLAIQISGARIDPELEVRFFVLVYKNPPPDAGNEEDEGND